MQRPPVGGHLDEALEVKLAIYRYFAREASRPSPSDVAKMTSMPVESVLKAFGRLRTQRVLLLEPDETSIRMAPPFSGVPTQHEVHVEGKRYFANCAWDALGIPAALRRAGEVHSRCEQTLEPLHLRVGLNGPGSSDWLFHCLVPASQWWDDLVFT